MKHFFLIGILFFSIQGRGQNLVPNPSFEDTLPNPNWGVQPIQNTCQDWSSPGPGTADYESNLDPLCFNCASGLQIPRTGSAFAGIGIFDPFDPSQLANSREIITVRLLDSLKAGRKYCVSFYVSRSEEQDYACANIGALFTSFPITTSTGITNYQAQIENDTAVNKLLDSNGWMLISGSFVAAGGEQYLTITNFIPDSISDITFVGNSTTGDTVTYSYYYVDDVSVYECDDTTTESSLTIPNVFTPNRDGINDYFQVTDTAIKTFSCKIFNRWGNEIFSTVDIDKPWNGKTKDGQDCSEGTYYYVISATGEDGKQYLRKGFVTLLR